MPEVRKDEWTPAGAAAGNPSPVVHRSSEFDEAGHRRLQRMQRSHFWYLGRHRFLLRMLRESLKVLPRRAGKLAAVDIGGGCGGWVRYLGEHAPQLFGTLALADSSAHALKLSQQVVGASVQLIQADLLNLNWHERWDVIFLLDVLEHMKDELRALREIKRALRPGGLLILSVPALQFFWSHYDELVLHQRRYSRADFDHLAEKAGLTLERSRYFNFFLSPLLLASRLRRLSVSGMSEREIDLLLERSHAVPPAPLNLLLRGLFELETPLGCRLAFPWGTSVAGVFQKPAV